MENKSLDKIAAEFHEIVSDRKIYPSTYADKRQKNGQFAPAFPPPSVEDEEKYIEKMLERDRKTA